MNASRFPALALFVLAPAAVALAGTRPAGATDTSCAAHATCVSNVNAQHLQTCAELRREDKHAPCPPLDPTTVARQCSGACAPPPVSGVLRPKYMVVSVVYAPPGSAGKGSSSVVDYGTASTTGTNLSTGSSFQNDLSTTASVTLGTPLTSSLQLDATLGGTVTNGSTDTLDVKKKASLDLKVSGPSTDGIDHNQDEVWVALSPIVNVSAAGTVVTWSLSSDSTSLPQFARVAWLKNPSTMPTNVAQTFAAYGFTTADFNAMLARDPYAYYPGRGPGVLQNVAAEAPDPSRFVLKDFVTYEPDAGQTQQVYALTNDTTTTVATNAQDKISVGLSATAGGGFADWVKVSLKVSDTWTWTNTSTTSSSTDWTQSASATVVNPSLAYTGATDSAVYWDSIYRTFLFMPVGPGAPPLLTGEVLAESGQPIAGADVVMSVGGQSVHAFADRKGVYRAYGLPSGNAQISVGSITQSVVLGTGTAKANFKIVGRAVAPRPAGATTNAPASR